MTMLSDRTGSPMITLALLLAASFLLSQSLSVSAQLVPLTKAEKQLLLDTHNTLRARTARGETPGQPSAADMMLLEWDDRLMDKAAAWAAQCTPGHDTKEQRLIPGYTWVGQNWAGGDTQNLTLLLELLYDEYRDFTYSSTSTGDCKPDKVCGHYTQFVWAKSLLLGCASAKCSSHPRILVCNYARGGNMGTEPPYTSGAPASQCMAEYTFTDGNVCLHRDQCSASSSCRCNLKCLNGGKLDATNCKCVCTPDFSGFRCEVPCADSEMFRSSCETEADACKTMGNFCSKTCRLCTNNEIRDRDAVNPDGVVARVAGR